MCVCVYIILIIIIRGQFIKCRKWWFGPPHQGRFDIFNDDGQRVLQARPELPAPYTLLVQAATNYTPINV